MDNCLASNSETGGVGCDNMTMLIIGLLRDKSKEEWYDTIAKRVADGDGPCAPPEYGTLLPTHCLQPLENTRTNNFSPTAEFRGPGKRGRSSDEIPDEFDEEESNGDLQTAIRSGRIIMLGDGTEVLTDSDADMFDDEQYKDEKDDEALTKGPNKDTKTDDTEMTDAVPKPSDKAAENEKLTDTKEGQTGHKGGASA